MYKSRINKIKGQINGIEKMLDEQRGCMEVIQQIAAVRSALAKIGVELLKDEAKECMIDQKKGAKSLEETIDKLFKIT